jgi:Flp pilus assembly protein TadG
MKLIARTLSKVNKDQRGASLAEFAMVAGFFFTLILGIIEFSRLLYTHNALADAARRGARYAVLNPKDSNCAIYAAVYGETHITKTEVSGHPPVCASTGTALLNGLTPSNVTVSWAGSDEDMNPSTAASTDYGQNLGTATVSVQNYDFNLSIPFFRMTLRMPAYRTTLNAESAGIEP